MKATIVFYNESGKLVSKNIHEDAYWATSSPGKRIGVDFEVPAKVRRPFYVSVRLSVPDLMKMIWNRMVNDIYREPKP